MGKIAGSVIVSEAEKNRGRCLILCAHNTLGISIALYAYTIHEPAAEVLACAKFNFVWFNRPVKYLRKAKGAIPLFLISIKPLSEFL